MMNGNVPSDVSERDFPIVADDERQRSVLRFPARIPLSRLMPNGSASVRYFRTTHPLFPTLRRRIRERANNDASVRHFRITLPLSPRFGGGYGRERTAMPPSGGSGQGFPIPRASAAGTGENERQFPVRRFRTRLPLLRLRRRVRERTNSNVPVWRFRAGAELKGEKTHEARNLYV